MSRASTYDALVVGAGPAGSAAAWALARGGARVALVDRYPLPRDKVCGDALISDALGAIDAMGLRAALVSEAVRLRELRVFAPSGRFLRLAGSFSCLPRLRLDAMLAHAAVQAGATLLEGLTAVGAAVHDGRVAGGAFMSGDGPCSINAPFTLLATGANASVMNTFGLEAPLKPNGVAGRAYYQVPPHLAAQFPFLTIVYDKTLCPGYGWIFPGPQNRFNLGVGFFARARNVPSLHVLWRRFVDAFGPAAEIVKQSMQISEFRGAPLRTGLTSATFGRPGLLVIGEAAAMTYPATGEGIGKAMESGLLAGGLVADALAAGSIAAPVHDTYKSAFLGRFETRYRAYRRAEACTARPWLLNFLAWRGNVGTFVREELEALVDERVDRMRLLSLKGLATALFR